MLDRNLHVPLADEALEFLSPLDEQNAASIHQVIEGQGIQFALGIDAVQVDVIKRQLRSAVFVNEREGRAGNALRLRSAKALGNAFYQGGLPCPQIAAEEHDV